MAELPYVLQLPQVRSSSVVFASPHSGRDYPAAFVSASQLDERMIRSSEDAYVDILFGAVPRFGAPLLAATAPRAYVDLNRSHEELDPALIAGVRPANGNPRVSSGLGVVPRVVANGRAIYAGKLSRAEVTRRLDTVWHPYHDCLQQLLTQSHGQFGEAILIDCHSMPHEAIESVGFGRSRPEIVLGDRFGAACGAGIVDRIEQAFVRAGLRVSRNAPFAGAYTAQHYGRPSRNQHVVQVEIDRALYLDETTVRPRRDFDAFRALMTEVSVEIAAIGRRALPLAAE